MLERLLLLCEKYPLDFVSHLSSSLPVILGLYRFRFLSKIENYIVALFLFFFVKESVALWLSILKKNNLYLQNLESTIGILLVLLMALICFQYNKRSVWIVAAIGSILIAILTYKPNQVSSESLSISRLFSIVFCLAYFNKLLADIRVKNILVHTMFWFVSGLLIYSTGTFFITLLSQYWYKDSNQVSTDIFDKYWNVCQILFIIFSCLSAYGLWLSKYEKENMI